ncbi:hypothetical protein FBU30_009371 [Linnemannia zychae]|nr:hypothetical protein FBU30_009371 [Linnemannia zychae]
MAPSTAHSPTLLTIPAEVLEGILLFLSQHDLTQCIRVSQAWNKAFVPYLWETLKFSSRRQINQFLTKQVQRVFLKNAKFVRVLHILHKESYDRFLPSRHTLTNEPGIIRIDVFAKGPFTNLVTLELHHLRYPVDDHDQRIVALIRQNPSLRRLKIGIKMDSETVMCLVKSYLPNLQDMDISTLWHGDVKALLMSLPECIKVVVLGNVRHKATFNTGKGSRVKSDVKLPMTKQHHALESISIGGILNHLAGQEENILVPFLKTCSRNLKYLGGSLSGLLLLNCNVAEALLDLGLDKMELSRIALQSSTCDATTARGISLNPDWIVIDMPLRYAGPLTAAAIIDNCKNLQILDLLDNRTFGVNGSHLQAILNKATRLKTLRAHWLLDLNKISADDILSSEWATDSLEYIDFKIHALRINEFTPNSTAEDVHFSRDTQRRVLQRIGQQIHLKELIIGGMAINPYNRIFGHQRTCLELTLECGLDELINLKELELLDIHHMDHRVGIPELEWLDKNLPNLRLLDGIGDSFIPPSSEVLQWLRDHRPEWR